MTTVAQAARNRLRNPTGVLASLAIPDYRLLLTSNTLWWQALYMEMIVLGWLVLELTDSAGLVGLIGFCRSIPFLFVGGFGGLLADRLGRRPLIVRAQAVTLAVYVAVAVLLATGALALWHLVVLALLLGSAWATDWPTRRALVPDLVGRARTVDALLLENLGQGIARTIGPFIAGFVIASFGALGCFLVLCGLAAASLALLLALSKQPIPRTSNPARSSPLAQMKDGLRYVRHNQPILAVVFITMIMNMLIFPYMTLLPVFARDVLAQGPVGLGYLGAAVGIGSFGGLYLIERMRRSASPGWIFIVGTFGQCLALLAFAASSVFSVSWALLLLVGIGHACFGIMQSSIVLLAATDEMRGQAMGAIVLAIGAGPFGKLQTGLLAQSFGAPLAVGGEAALGAVLIVAVAVGLPGLRDFEKVKK